MYFPYFRGKQFELILLREQAGFFAREHQVPVIAPVRRDIKQLRRTIEALNEAFSEHIVIANPSAGDHAEDYSALLEYLREIPPGSNTVIGFKLDFDTTNTAIIDFFNAAQTKQFALIHNGYQDHAFLEQELNTRTIQPKYNIFLTNPGTRYRHKFKANSVIIEDGFQQMRNRDYPPLEFFSDLHFSHTKLGYDHFGDYLTVGEQFREGGGPAYAVAIHLTYLNKDDDNAVWIRHYISDSNDSPYDPGGKTYEALAKLHNDYLSTTPHPLPSTPALNHLLNYFSTNHYPGLGMLKKLSMWHHLCVMANAHTSY